MTTDPFPSPEELTTELEHLADQRAALLDEIDAGEREALSQRQALSEQRRALRDLRRQEDRLQAELDSSRKGLRGWFGRRRSRAQLRAEVARLEKELEGHRRVTAAQKKVVGWGTRRLAGADLTTAFRTWVRSAREARSPRDLLSEPAADLGAALVKRMVRVGLLGLIVALLPGLFSAWQAFLMRGQLQEQTLQREQWAEDTMIARRAQLVDILYAEDCEEAEEPDLGTPAEELTELLFLEFGVAEPTCRPRAHPRARKEALLAFVALERRRGVAPDLSFIVLTEPEESWDRPGEHIDLASVDLSHVRLHAATMNKVFLGSADFEGANLSNASLSNATLALANFRDADITGALLRSANLRRANFANVDVGLADLSGADLSGANLSGANLSHTLGLTQDQINKAVGDEYTLLPIGLQAPSHWLGEPQAGASDSN